jgi:putative oxidoreductase
MSTITETPTPATTPTTTKSAPTTAKATGPTLAAVRVVISALFVCHGLQGLFGFFGGIDGHGTAVPLFSWPGWIGSLIEVVCAVLIAFGLFTRISALLCSGCMAYAYFFIHLQLGAGPVPLLNGGEQAVLYCWIFLLFAVVGPGSFALDGLFKRRRSA